MIWKRMGKYFEMLCSTFSNNYAHGSHGPDYVDYGAYTGGYGAFGWYSDHPVGGYHRR